ncbi:MAG: hypothetical protein ACODAC_08310 [Pseudomonadota bacterium]
MMRKLILAGVVCAFAGAAHAAELDTSRCAFPEAPEVPDGAEASEEEMGAAGAAVKEYVEGVQASLQCLAEVEQSMGEDITEEQQGELVDTYNDGVERMNAVADRYNEQVRVYKGEE